MHLYPALRLLSLLPPLAWGLLVCLVAGAAQAQQPATDSVLYRPKTGRRPVFSVPETPATRFSGQAGRSPLGLKDPLRSDFRYDPLSGSINVTERLSDSLPYRPGEQMSLQDYLRIQNDAAYRGLLRDYSARYDKQGELTGRGLFPRLRLTDPSLDRLFGSNLVDFLPNGSILLDIGYRHQSVDNPMVPITARRNGNLIFNQQIQLNFLGKIGNKLGLNTNFDTKAAFNFENQLKLNFKNEEEDIIQRVEAGNTNFITNSQLIPGVQNLFGAKVGLRFGRLDMTLLAAQQRSKRQSITLRNGAQNRPFEIREDQYDENRHFFLSQFFRNQYESALRSLPMITSGVTITRVEVYVTNRSQNTTTLRNLVGLADLGEASPYNRQTPLVQPIGSQAAADNAANGLYQNVSLNPTVRQIDNVGFELDRQGYSRGVDYDVLRGARKLEANEFYVHPQLGYLSLLAPLRNDEVLAVSFEYTYQGRRYKVGELTEDYQNRQQDEVLVLKLLKSATIRNHTNLPMWDLMMKNVYSLASATGGITAIGRQGFQLRVVYKDDRTGVDNPNLQETSLKDIPLVRLMNLDRLNQMNDPQPDGNFDFVEEVTVSQRLGRPVIIFPVLEPFGNHLRRQFSAADAPFFDKYIQNTLYRGTQIDASLETAKNKFFLRGSYQGATGTEIQLPGFGIDERSVQVTVGGVSLTPGTDFVIEAGGSSVRIMNESLLSSGREITVSWENPDLFSNQIRTLVAGRFDYRLGRDVNLGATLMKLNESTPGNYRRVGIGNEPMNNFLFGTDLSLRKESMWLTRLLDALPLLQTRELSSVAFTGEYARLMPGTNKRIQSRFYIDDFENARIINDLTRQPTRWRLGATPLDFPQGSPANPLEYAYRRARISAYSIDMSLDTRASLANTIEFDRDNYYQHLYLSQAIFRGKAYQNNTLPLNTLDLAYFPEERGPYNFNPSLTPDGLLPNPRQNFGAVSRGLLNDNDFTNANVEVLEFWLLNPFMDGPKGRVYDGRLNQNNTTGGKLIVHLGDISEDVIPDSRFNFENGLPAPGTQTGSLVDSTAWGLAPRQQFVVNAFDANNVAVQDVGLDGVGNQREQGFFRNYLSQISSRVSPLALEQIRRDPSADDFQYFISEEANAGNWELVQRYKRYSGLEGNSPPNTARNQQITPASTNLPDTEDLNADNTVNEANAYYEYEVPLQPGQMRVGNGFIVDEVVVPENQGGGRWFLFRVPLDKFTGKKGSIDGFRSIRFMRMVMTDFQQPVVLRFAQLQLTGYQYRKFNRTTEGPDRPLEEDNFAVTTVNIEENGPGGRLAGAVPYVLPPGYQRDRDITTFNNAQLNEQSLSLCVNNLAHGQARAVFRNVNHDLSLYRRLTMHVHMDNPQTESDRVSAFMRLGTDFRENYYEVELIRLKATDPLLFNASAGDSEQNRQVIWPDSNRFDFAIDDLRRAKAERNRTGTGLGEPFYFLTDDGRYKITVVGNPDLSAVQVLMLGVRNGAPADAQPRSFCVWFNEFHTTDFDRTQGQAAIGRADIKLADFATVSLTGSLRTYGFGGVQSRVQERSRDLTAEFGVASNVQLDRLLPQRWGLQIPFFVSYDRRNVKPHFNPLDPDMELSRSLGTLPEAERTAYRQLVEENATRKAINFSNVRKVRVNPARRAHFYDIENLAFTYSYADALRSSITLQEYRQLSRRGGFTYSYVNVPHVWEPFRKWKNDRHLFQLLKDFNLSLLPSSVTVRADMDRSFFKTQLRDAAIGSTSARPEVSVTQAPLIEKYWLFNRFYNASWNLSKSLVTRYTANAQAIIDEPYGEIDTDAERDSVRKSLLRFGRTRNFDQRIENTWQLPLAKTPLTDWMTAQLQYDIQYRFQANSFNIRDTLGIPFGNTAQNHRTLTLTGRVDLVALYNKVRYLKFANSPRAPRRDIARSPGDFEDVQEPSNALLKAATRALLTVRGIRYAWSDEVATILPGMLPYPRFFGLSRNGAPGLPFVLGSQDAGVRYRAAERGWLSSSTVQNEPFVQTRIRRFEATTDLEPFRDFKLFVDMRWNRSDNYQEFFRPATVGGPFVSQSPLRSGNYSMSYLSFLTAFDKTNLDNYSANFERFKGYRNTLLSRLRQANPAGDNYNLNSQDVLIPAFFAAYSGKSPEKVRFSPFYKFPLPNWRLSYNGLASVDWFKRRFSQISINHQYHSTYSVGSFVSSLEYNAAFVGLNAPLYPFATQLNAENQFIPVYVMSVISFEERFSPFLGLSLRTKKSLTATLDYNQDRNVGLNLSNVSVNEITNKSLLLRLGTTRQNLRLNLFGNRISLKNDVIFDLVLRYTDNRMLIRKLEGETVATAGNIFFQFNPSVSYNASRRVNVRVYFDRTVNNPLVSTSFRRAITQGGVQIRLNLAE